MRKRILFIALLIISVFVVGSVNAATSSTSFSAKIINDPAHGWSSHASGSAVLPTYKTQGFLLQIGTTTYPAYCVDPGKHKANDVTCEPLDVYDYPMLYYSIMNSGLMNSDFLTKDLVFRTLGIMEISSVNYAITHEFTHDAVTENNTNSKILTLLWGSVVQKRWPERMIGHVSEANTPKGGSFTNASGWITSAIEYWGNPTGLLSVGNSLSSHTYTYNGTDGKYFKLQKTTGGTKANPRYIVTKGPLSAGLTVKDVSISGDNGSAVGIVQPWNGTNAIVTLSKVSSGACEARISITATIPDATGADLPKSPFLCKENSALQKYVALVPGVVTEKFIIPLEDCDSCTEHEIIKDNKESTDSSNHESVDGGHLQNINVNLCCEPNTHSFMEEYKLDELFLSSVNTYIGASFYTDKCNDTAYVDEDLTHDLHSYIVSTYGSFETTTESEESYCRILCVEDMAVDVPGSIISATGKFFKLAEMPGGGKGPKITGNKACRIKIDYRTLRAHYEQAVNGEVTDDKNGAISNATDGEVDYFNVYQDKKSLADLINNPSAQNKTHTSHPTTVHFSRTICTESKTYTASPGGKVKVYKYNGTGECEAYDEKECAKTATADCEYSGYTNKTETAEKTPAACTMYYDIYEIKPKSYLSYTSAGSGASQKYTVKYYRVDAEAKLKYTNGAFSGAKIITSRTDTMTHTYERYSKYNLDTSKCDKSIEDAKKAYSSDDGWGVTSGGSYAGDVYETDHKDYAYQNPNATWGPADKAASNAYTSFQTKKKIANDLERIIQGCEKFFNTQPDAYKLNLKADFHYMQVYLDGTRQNKSDPGTIPFGTISCDSGCNCTKTPTNPQTSTIFKDTIEAMQDVKEIPTKVLQAATDMSDSATNFEKSVREDIIYKAECQFPDPDEDGSQTIYLYPGPTFEKGTAIDGTLKDKATGHKYQYALFLTTYSSEFETYWEISGLGTDRTKEKFMKEFNNHRTCADDKKALSLGAAENLKSGTNKVPFTCILRVRDGGMRIGTCCKGVTSDLDDCCGKPYVVNEVFEFRVVDPSNIFPSNDKTKPAGTWIDKSANWKTDAGDWGRTFKKIQDDADKDLTYAPSNLTYTYRIDTNTIKLIKEYNNKHDYDSFDQTKTCHCENGPENDSCGTIEPGGSCKSGNKWVYSCTQCTSQFLTNLSGSTGTVNTANDTGRKVWNRSASIASIRSDDKTNDKTAGVHWA